MEKFDNPVLFTTITNLIWIKILENDFHKQIIMEALQHRVKTKQVTIFGFVIMLNHLHILWRINESIKKSDFQRDLLKFTARSILKFMLMNDDPMLASLKVVDADREYQVWERNALSIEVYKLSFFLQKLHYIHNNPLQAHWQLASLPEEYFYSSAKFYTTGVDEFNILTHYSE